MKIRGKLKPTSAFTALELLVVLTVAAMIATWGLILPGRSKSKCTMTRYSRCASNLKQIGLSFMMFAGDNNQEYPFQTAGSLAYTNDQTAWLHYEAISNELGSAHLLVCPLDVKYQTAATDFNLGTNAGPTSLATLGNAAVSYFVGLDAKQGSPQAQWLAGDANLGIGGASPKGNVLTANDRSKLLWTKAYHDGRPNVVMADGSISMGSNYQSRAPWPANTTNRLLLPR